MSNYIFVDVEAFGAAPIRGKMTEFGAVHEKSLKTFHGVVLNSEPDPENPAKPLPTLEVMTELPLVMAYFQDWLKEVCGNDRPVFVSDNVAYDWMWIACAFDESGLENPFGHSGRRISDFWAGLNNKWSETQSWKRFRRTKHDHNPVNDAMGNVEAFQEIKKIAEEQRNAN